MEEMAKGDYSLGIGIFLLSTVVLILFLAYICLRYKRDRIFFRRILNYTFLIPVLGYLFSCLAFFCFLGPVFIGSVEIYVSLASGAIATGVYFIGAGLYFTGAYCLKKLSSGMATQQQWYGGYRRFDTTKPGHSPGQAAASTPAQQQTQQQRASGSVPGLELQSLPSAYTARDSPT